MSGARASGEIGGGRSARSGRAEGQDGDAKRVALLFVCLGNICRSPTAEGVMRALLAERGLEDRVLIDSAGTGSWHVGDRPDARATAAAATRQITLTGCARQVEREDFERFDLLLAMDDSNARELRRLAPDEEAAAKVRLLREFANGVTTEPATGADLDVPDPYYGGEDGFARVLDLVQEACEGLLNSLRLDAPHRRE